MPQFDSTCWQNIERAAMGSVAQQEQFAARYAAPVRAYIGARWASTPLSQEVEDATQEVFIECLKAGGALANADPGRKGGFRPFLYGITRNVALRFEARRHNGRERRADTVLLDGLSGGDEQTLTRQFDRAWAAGIIRQAFDLMVERAAEGGDREQAWVRILRARFEESLPIREIAAGWGVDAAWLHHEFAHARKSFRTALGVVVGHHSPGLPDEIDEECRNLLLLLAR